MTIIEQIATYLQTNGIGTIATDIFISYLPDDNTKPCVVILDTGGPRPDIDLPFKNPTFQVFVRAATYESGRLKLDAIRALLHQKMNAQLVSGQDYFYSIFATSEGGHIGRNESGLDEFSMNFLTKIR